jgi:hypothetical protein
MTDPTQQLAAGRSPQWLNAHARNVTSQHGEDGMIEHILDMLGETDGWCVEFGAWDGVAMSNTYNLISSRNYHAVLIEGGRQKFRQLQRNHRTNQRVIPVRAMVGLDSASGLDRLLQQHAPQIPQRFDLLSIDIDGNDYHVWDDVRHYQPKVVVIEYNPTIPNPVVFVQPRDGRVAQGSSVRAFVELGRRKGYELVATTWSNLLFVDTRYFARFNIADNSLDTLRSDDSSITYIFSGFDGTVFVRGYQRLPWHRVPIRERRVQQLPRWLRRYPGDYGLLGRAVIRAFEYWHFGPRRERERIA